MQLPIPYVHYQKHPSSYPLTVQIPLIPPLIPDATVVPTVLFTQRKKWRKDVSRRIESHLGNRQFLHFEYQLIRLFDFQARDYYDHHNPIVKILLPKMDYKPEERAEVIQQAYLGLFRLAAPMLFDKYVDFIDL